MSILGTILNEKIQKASKEEFLIKESEKSGIPVDVLTQVYDKAISESANVILAKGKVYSFIKSQIVKEDEDSSEDRYYRIWDGKEKRWVSKASKQRARLRSRVDTLDNEYGAYRYQLIRVDSEGNRL